MPTNVSESFFVSSGAGVSRWAEAREVRRGRANRVVDGVAKDSGDEQEADEREEVQRAW